jgi:hypothetical protein
MIPCGMKQDDARKLDHATLEAMRMAFNKLSEGAQRALFHPVAGSARADFSWLVVSVTRVGAAPHAKTSSGVRTPAHRSYASGISRNV